MRVALDIKNMSKIKNPTANDVIIYDGKRWYVTTKEEILKEANDLLLECKETLEQLRAENQEFKRQTSKDILEITDTTKKLLELKGEKL